MSAYLILMIDTKSLKVESASIASQSSAMMSVCPRGKAYTDLLHFSSTSYSIARQHIFRWLIDAWEYHGMCWVVSLLLRNELGELSNLVHPDAEINLTVKAGSPMHEDLLLLHRLVQLNRASCEHVEDGSGYCPNCGESGSLMTDGVDGPG